MINQTGRAFNEWLRAQLKAKKMSQRQLAQQSGVDHSTISRLIRGDRMPSLGTATKLARGLREIREDADTAQYLSLVTGGSQNPTARVEYALRADDALGEGQVRQIMEYYLAVRTRRFGRVFHAPDHAESGSNGRAIGAGAAPRTQAARTSRPEPEPVAAATGARPLGYGPRPLPDRVGQRPLGYGPRPVPAAGNAPRVGVATNVTSTSTLTRPSGRDSERY
jgi:transcriptional regulator with XRE-family HTH domain